MRSQDRVLDMNVGMNPTRVEIELTEKCNLQCMFCYNSQEPLISTNYTEIINRLESQRVLEVVLTGGEPTLHPNFKEILSLCSHKFAKVMVQTNGTLIDDDLADWIKSKDTYGVNISIHGSKSIHDKLTCNQGSYDLAISAVKRLLDRNVRTASNFVLTKLNCNELGETIDTLYSIGLRELTMTRFTPVGCGSNNNDLFLPIEDVLSALDCAKKKMKEYNNLRIILANSFPNCSLPNELKFFCDSCHFGISRFYIDINGNVLMCGMSRLVIGNILDSGFREMKQSSDIYLDHVRGHDTPGICQECESFNTCRGGCRAAALACTSEINGADPYINRRD